MREEKIKLVKRYKVQRKLNQFKHECKKRPSYQVNVPPEMVDRLGWEKGDVLDVEQKDGAIRIRKRRWR